MPLRTLSLRRPQSLQKEGVAMADALDPVRGKFLANGLPIAKQQLGMVIGLLLLLLVATFVSERFLTFPNLLNVLRQVAIVGILAIGQTFVILTAGIDLSVGSSLGLTVVFLAGLLQNHGLLTSIPLGISAAAAIGFSHGVDGEHARVPAFIKTLGMLSFGKGIAFIYTGGTPIPVSTAASWVSGGDCIAGIPIPSLILL